MSNETSLGSSTTHEDIVDTLSFFDDWERYTYIIELGKALPPYPEALKIESHLVRGCQSQVWLHIEVNDDGTLSLYVDSDALIVRGLAAIVLAALNQKTPQQILGFDMQAYFHAIDLLKRSGPSRGNGVRSLVERIRHEAQKRLAA